MLLLWRPRPDGGGGGGAPALLLGWPERGGAEVLGPPGGAALDCGTFVVESPARTARCFSKSWWYLELVF